MQNSQFLTYILKSNWLADGLLTPASIILKAFKKLLASSNFKIMYIRAIISLLTAVISSHVLSQSNPHMLDKVEVNATQNPSILGDSTLRTVVISNQEIEMNHAKTLDDALRYTPGIEIKPLGDSAENGSGISIQGLDPSQVLVMVDGNPVAPNSGDMVDAVDISQILIGNVESIEIVQGGASAIYGAGAMGGVVNIITKTPSNDFSFSADVSSGNWGGKSDNQVAAKNSASFSTAGKTGKLSTQITASLLSQEGFDSDPNSIGTDGWHGFKNNLSGKIQYNFNETNKLIISPSIYQSETATYTESKAIDEITKERASIQNRNTLGVTYFGLLDSLHYKLHIMDQSITEEKDSTSSDRLDQSSKNKAYSLKLDQPLPGHFISLNINHKYEFLSQFNITEEKYVIKDKSKKSTDIAVSDSLYFYSDGDIEIVPAIRFNQDENYGTRTSPMLSILYSNDRWLNGDINIRSSVTDGYKTPTLMELYWEFDHNGDIMYFGNPNLVPETSLNAQLGFEFINNSNSRFEIHFFNNEISNLIAQQSNPDRAEELEGVNTVYEFENIKSARTTGFNTSFNKTLSNISFNVSYSYLNAINLLTGKRLPKKSRDQFNLSANIFNSNNTSLSIKYRYNSKQFTDFDNTTFIGNYDLVDLKCNQTINRNTDWYLGIDNIFDNTPDQYSTSGGHETSGNDAYTKTPKYMYLGIRLKI